MDRRQIIRLGGGTAVFAASTEWPRGSMGATKIARVGIIDEGPDWEAFRRELHELNYIEGQNITFDYRQADGTPDRLAVAARELAQIPVDVIAVYGTPAPRRRNKRPNLFPSSSSPSAICPAPDW
jgi:putative tryptophan/tyrosine transport system substrate-binding protein